MLAFMWLSEIYINFITNQSPSLRVKYRVIVIRRLKKTNADFIIRDNLFFIPLYVI